MKKLFKAVIVSVLALALCAACSSSNTEKTEPAVSLSVTVEPLSEDEYAQTDTSEIENAVPEDFSKITIELNMENMVAGTERTVKMKALKNIMTETEIGTYWYGNGSSQNNAEEDFTIVRSESVLYRRDISNDEIKNMFDGYEAAVSYTGADGNVVEQSLPMTDALQFK